MQIESGFSHTAKLYESNFGNAPEAFDAVFVHLRMGDLNSAKRSADEVLKISSPLIWNSYLISVKRGETARAKKLEQKILSKLTFIGRGGRSTLRFDLYYRGIVALNNGKGDEAIEFSGKCLATRRQPGTIRILKTVSARPFSNLDVLTKRLPSTREFYSYRQIIRSPIFTWPGRIRQKA